MTVNLLSEIHATYNLWTYFHHKSTFYFVMSKQYLETLGKNVRQLRLEKGLSQEALADRCGLHRTYLGGIERGERNVSLLNIIRIAKALDVNVVELVHDIG